MIKLFVKIFISLFFLYITVFLYIDNFPMYYNSIDNTRWYYVRQVFDKKLEIDPTKIIFLGDSRLETNVDVKKIPKAWSFATGGASPVEMYYALQNCIKIYSDPDTVFISFSPRTFIQAYSFWGYAVRNKYFSIDEFKEISVNLKSFPNDTVLGKFPMMNYWFYKFNYIKYYQADIHKNHVFMAWKKNKKAIQNFQKEKGIWIYPGLKNGSSELNFESNLKSFEPSGLLNLYLIKILDLCEKKNVHVIFDFMPMNESSYARLDGNFVTGYKNYIKSIASKYPGFTFSDTIYSYKDQYFGDASHLNSSGKEVFTENKLEKYFDHDR